MTESVKDKRYHYDLLEENRRKSIKQASDLNKTMSDLASIAPPPADKACETAVTLPPFPEVDYRLRHALEETDREMVVWSLRHRRRKTA